jgi:hypothetical protein
LDADCGGFSAYTGGKVILGDGFFYSVVGCFSSSLGMFSLKPGLFFFFWLALADWSPFEGEIEGSGTMLLLGRMMKFLGTLVGSLWMGPGGRCSIGLRLKNVRIEFLHRLGIVRLWDKLRFLRLVEEGVRGELGEGSGVFVRILGDERKLVTITDLMFKTSLMSWSFSFSLVFL